MSRDISISIYACVECIFVSIPSRLNNHSKWRTKRIICCFLTLLLLYAGADGRKDVMYNLKGFGFEKSFVIAKDVGNFTILYGNFDLVIVSCTSGEVHLLVFRFLQNQIINLYPVYLPLIYLLQLFENQIRM